MKSDITEKLLLSLGFKRNDVSSEESGDNPFHYFSYDTTNHNTLLITNASDECIDGFYFVEYFELPEIGKIVSAKDLKKLINLTKSFKQFS